MFVFFVGQRVVFKKNDLVRFVPTPGPKDKAFIVPMIHLPQV